MFWSDRIARLLIERKKYNYIDKPVKKPKQFVIKSSTSISGVPHIGNASDVIRHDAVVRSLEELGEKVRFIWVSEDMDPLRKVPAGIPLKFKKYLGMPVSSLPCPFGCCESYVKHFDRLFIESLHEHFGTKPELLSTTDAYKSGEFYPYVKLALKNIDVIKAILNKNRTTPLPKLWSPLKPVCENCGKIITTRIKDVEEDVVTYTCEDYSFREFGEKAYTKVTGCGYKGDCDISKGNYKLLWSVEWGAEWPLWKVNFEGAGKEHFMPGGSFWRAGEICERVFDWPEPYPGRNEIQPYEYILVNGEKMSASKGNVVATWEWPEFAPPEILRMLLLKRPNRTRGFSYQKIPDLVDEFDELKEVYYGKKIVKNEKEERDMKRLYEMSVVKKEDEYTPNISFRFASMIVQIIPNSTGDSFQKVLELLQRTGQIQRFDKKTKENILKRLKQAENWVKNYAPESMRIKPIERITERIINILDEKQKIALKLLGEFLKSSRTDGEIWSEIRNISEKIGIERKKIFDAAYLVLLGKTHGPRLVPFVQTLDKEFVVKRFLLEG